MCKKWLEKELKHLKNTSFLRKLYTRTNDAFTHPGSVGLALVAESKNQDDDHNN